MVQHRKFLSMALDEEGLHTPDGVLVLSSITRAEVIRNRSRDYGESDSGSYGAGILGGALIGGAIAGPLGAVGGGLLGASEKRDSEGGGIPRTVSATLIFESADLAYSTTVARDRVDEAEAFVAAVRGAAGL